MPAVDVEEMISRATQSAIARYVASSGGGGENVMALPRLNMPEKVTVSRDLAQSMCDCLGRVLAALTMAEQTAEGAMLAYRQEKSRVHEVEQRLKQAIFSAPRARC